MTINQYDKNIDVQFSQMFHIATIIKLQFYSWTDTINTVSCLNSSARSAEFENIEITFQTKSMLKKMRKFA